MFPPPANIQPPPRPVEPELDYRRPVRLAPVPLEKETELFSSRCLRGDRDACLRVAMRFRAEDVLPQLEANCKAGHDLSCRALLPTRGLFGKEYPKLSRTELRRGCAGGLWAECDLLVESNVREDARYGAEIECLYVQRFCSMASSFYESDESPNYERARYLLELACQSGDTGSCMALVYAYTEGRFEEPMPGRARELIPLACLGLDDCPGDRFTTK